MFAGQHWLTQARSSLSLSFPTLTLQGEVGLLRGILRDKSIVPGHVKKPSFLWLWFFPDLRGSSSQITDLGAHSSSLPSHAPTFMSCLGAEERMARTSIRYISEAPKPLRTGVRGQK